MLKVLDYLKTKHAASDSPNLLSYMVQLLVGAADPGVPERTALVLHWISSLFTKDKTTAKCPSHSWTPECSASTWEPARIHKGILVMINP